MDYFDGLKFICWGEDERCTALADRVFEDYYGIQYTHSGVLSFSQGAEAFQTVEGPHVFISYPGVRLRYGTLPGHPARHHVFACFRGARIERFLASGLLSCGGKTCLLPVLQSGAFYQQLKELHACLAQGATQQARAVHILEGLLLQIKEQEEMELKRGRLSVPLEELGRSIRERPGEGWDFPAEAGKLAVSYPHFRRVFQQHFGCAPGQFLQRCRVEAAAKILRESYDSLDKIARDLGFGDVYYFSRIFKKNLQLPPARYRKEFTR